MVNVFIDIKWLFIYEFYWNSKQVMNEFLSQLQS